MMSDETFSLFQEIVQRHTGIALADSKRSMVATRLNRRLKLLNIPSYEAYLHLVTSSDHPETIEFIDAITTNLTYFFREPHHFDLLRDEVLPKLVSIGGANNPIRIWSAGCSSGQEPYSIAITAKECSVAANRQVRILCTDIHTKLVRDAQLGIYNDDALRGISNVIRDKWFTRIGSNSWQANSVIRDMLICKQLNLFSPWPIRTGVDIIMCRNVLIYFNEENQKKLLTAFAGLQSTGGYLFLGHSETLDGFSNKYLRVANTVYQRQ